MTSVMKRSVSCIFGWISRNQAFVLTFMAMTGSMGLAYFKDGDINALLPTLLGIFVGSKTGSNISAHWAASRDGTTNTAEVIADVEGIERKPTPHEPKSNQ